MSTVQLDPWHPLHRRLEYDILMHECDKNLRINLLV